MSASDFKHKGMAAKSNYNQKCCMNPNMGGSQSEKMSIQDMDDDLGFTDNSAHASKRKGK